jgi:hypothetical protein
MKGVIEHPMEGYMRFRITKNKEGTTYTIVVSGEMNDDSCWDLLQVAQTMLHIPHCLELIVDLRAADIDDDVSVLNTDTLLSVFEEGLMLKDSALTLRLSEDNEIRFNSDQLPLKPTHLYENVQMDAAKVYIRAMKWLEQEARLLAN